jgi:plasmid maintenance system antidote protein VapI
MVDPSADKMAHQPEDEGVVVTRGGASTRQVPPDGHVSTTEAADMLGVTSSYVRQLIRNRSAGTSPQLAARHVVTNGGRELLYVNRQDVIELRNTGEVRSRRNKTGVPPLATTVDLASVSADGSTKTADQLTGQDNPPPPARDPEPNWGLELELATANARLVELQERVNVLEVLNGQLEGRYQETRARLRELARAQMQLLEGYAADQGGT